MHAYQGTVTPESDEASAAGTARGSEESTADTGDSKPTEKQFSTLRAELARASYALWRTDAADGPVSYFASRWGLVRELPNWEAVRAFAVSVGVR
jgi:hypothetical protein